jgi:AraC-like DNA-binding protein
MLRCFYAIRMLRDYPERSISEIALDAGFGSIRSFNREFQSIYGMTPHEKRFSPNSQ